MDRSSMAARLAGLGTSALLLGGMLAQATPVAAAAPGHFMPLSMTPDSRVHAASRPAIDVRALIARGPQARTQDAAAANAAIGAANPAAAASSTPKKATPAAVAPPPSDAETDSGAPAASIAVAVAGQGQPVSAGFIQPPEPGIAAGPDEIVQANDSSLMFVSRTGTGVATVDLTDFFGLPEPPTFTFASWATDPQVHFDSLRQRWIVTETSWDCATHTYPGDPALVGHGSIDYAISNTSDPLGQWTSGLFFWNDFFPDRPEIGTSTDKLALTANVRALEGAGTATDPGCVALDPLVGGDATFLDWSQLAPGFDGSKVTFRSFDLDVPDIHFAVQEPVTTPEIRFLFPNTSSNPTDLFYAEFSGSAVHNTLTGQAYDLTDDGIIPGVADAPQPQQPGGNLSATIDPYPDSVIFHNGILGFTMNVPCTPTGDTSMRDCVRVVSLDSAVAAIEPARLGDTLIGTNGFDDSFGGIAFSGNDVLHVVYTRSSATSDASSFEQYNLPSDTSLQWSAPTLLTAGAGAFADRQWGEYLQVAGDPQDPSAVWVGDPYVAASGKWATSIHELVVGGDGDGYTPIAPVRVLDTRFGTGLTGVFSANLPRTFQVGGVLGIPSDAVAITGNLTVTQQTAAGYVSLTPAPNPTPASSTLNFPLADTRANNVTIALAPDGSLSAVYKAAAGKHTALLLDVTGYFEAGSGQGYTPITPLRVLDTRFGTGLTGKFMANIARPFVVAGVGAIPADATAVTANLTVANQTKGGYVSVTPTADNNPATSTLNFPLNDTRANGLTIPLNLIDGSISAVYKAADGASADLILDVTGYYAVADGDELLFHPLNPGRRIDTLLPLGIAGLGNGLTGAQGTTPRSVDIADHYGVPDAAQAITGNLTITGQTAGGYVSVTDVSDSAPTTSTINFPLGDIRANGITSTLGATDLWFVYKPAAGKHVQLILDITGYFE